MLLGRIVTPTAYRVSNKRENVDEKPKLARGSADKGRGVVIKHVRMKNLSEYQD